MFKRLAENICYLLVRYKIVDIKEIAIYIYGLEVVLLNTSIALIMIVISLLMQNLIYLIVFALFFIPLRIFAGGWHAKSSGVCFLFSNIMYFISLLLYEHYSDLYQNPAIVLMSLLAIAFIIVFAPIVSNNHPLTSKKQKRNKIITALIGIFDCIMLILLCKLNVKIASAGMISVLLVALLILPMIIERKIKSIKTE